jgi:hypothetical protein
LAELGEGSGTLGGNHCDIRACLKTFLWNQAVHDRLRWHTDWLVPHILTGMELVKAFLKEFWDRRNREELRGVEPGGSSGRLTTRRASSWLPDNFEAKNSHCEVRDKASMFKGFGVEAL